MATSVFKTGICTQDLWRRGAGELYGCCARTSEREKIDFSRRNVLVSHQFYTGKGESPVTCDSEVLSVGGIDNVDISAVQEFDYVALGHLHGAQRVGQEKTCYCGRC